VGHGDWVDAQGWQLLEQGSCAFVRRLAERRARGGWTWVAVVGALAAAGAGAGVAAYLQARSRRAG
jgi:hypothetical protein